MNWKKICLVAIALFDTAFYCLLKYKTNQITKLFKLKYIFSF